MQKKSRILLVGNQPEDLAELERWLNCLDAETVRARTVAQAATLTKEQFFHLAIVCAEMPTINVPGLITQLRSQVHSANLPVLLLYPRFPDEAAFRWGIDAGADDFLFKPLLPSLLASKVGLYITRDDVLRVDAARAGTARLDARKVGKERAAHHSQSKEGDELFQWLSHSMEQIADAMASSMNMAEVPDLVLEQLAAVVPYERGSILLHEGNALRIVAQRGFPTGWPVTHGRIPLRQGDVYQQIVESRQALLLDDVTATSAWQQAEGLPLDRSWLGAPLVARDRVIGMVSLTRREAGAFRPEEVALMRALASQAAVALVNTGLLKELKRLNEQLEQLVQDRTEELKFAYEKLEKIDQTKTTFISVAAHELRTPLTLIRGYSNLLENMLRDNKDASGLVRGILTGENRLLEIVNSMVDVSKIDNQALEVHKIPLNLWAILKMLRAEFEPALKERRLTLTMLDVNNLPTIEADSELLSKLFRQLISNAIKYTPNGGTITLQGRVIPCNDVLDCTGDAVEVLVRDTGIGVDPAHQELIFEKFYQMGTVELHSSGKTKYKGGGPGLGLAIARGIAHAHKGRIWVESPGYNEAACPGSCFHVVLPVA